MNVDIVKQWLQRRGLAERLEESAKKARAEARELEAQVLDEFERDGVGSVKVEGVTVYMQRDLRARVKPECKDELIAWLLDSELSWLATPTVNANTLSAYVREQEKVEADLPEPLVEGIVVEEMFSVRKRG